MIFLMFSISVLWVFVDLFCRRIFGHDCVACMNGATKWQKILRFDLTSTLFVWLIVTTTSNFVFLFSIYRKYIFTSFYFITNLLNIQIRRVWLLSSGRSRLTFNLRVTPLFLFLFLILMTLSLKNPNIILRNTLGKGIRKIWSIVLRTQCFYFVIYCFYMIVDLPLIL